MTVNIQKVILEQVKLLRPDELVIKELKKKSKIFVDRLNEEIIKSKISADVFVGGSFAKGTLLKSDNYDVDIFVRFDWKYENLSEILEKLLNNVSKDLEIRIEKVHGSRDYFMIYMDEIKGYFEIIPVIKIKKAREERNVTDLTYFHGPYIKKRIIGLEDQVRLAKKFLKAQEVYGAETYVKGFSGYAVELLIIKYKSFIKMLRELVKVNSNKRRVIDLEKHYKNPNEVFIQLNESKIRSPIILIDPTYKERNALAALSHEAFEKFCKSARLFLKKPSAKFFEKKETNIEKIRLSAKTKNLDFLSLNISTNKQPGDIAGTKLKKFFDFLLTEINSTFLVKESYFKYDSGNTGFGYILAKSRKELIRIGPPLIMKKAVANFKNKHLSTFEKNRHIHAKIEVKFNLKEFIDSWILGSKTLLEQMTITKINLEN